ncbi:NAD(P)/FAD-dependent oxidoreductase [Pseudobacteriovorax antillogorgiicola]|uniref:Glycine/D-amino acid oxidase n=1 Tax=Pseudobacteriovorax antillogorgiicola TaxID=1513793 RepID=A0A1Y6CUV1_9BACT|nr:FAD-dependent oxidoreductase [Pseudobacteriovorax antillogorgiicola]TCS45011.1 glycine/D-amino acid oxidase-like deaminating enzyme [Pseudobacteriovorax antillogorgiicola]SMF76391.1 Glycine/D-amino acid oxidase [Pseudobacteriovorax antillogorgiicola]
MPSIPSHPYWLDVPAREGSKTLPKPGGICVIGSGLAGASAAYFLQQEGFDQISILDFEPEKAATFRNCGHILHGTVESMQALQSLHGAETARDIWNFSIEICDEVKKTVSDLDLRCDYQQNGYLVVAVDDHEVHEIHESIRLLRDAGFESEFVDIDKLTSLGFKNVTGGRYEPGSAQAHPVKFRNGLIQTCQDRGVRYHSGCEVISVEEAEGQVQVTLKDGNTIIFDAAVIATNAYSPLLSRFFSEHKLVEPFRGQILTTKPLKHDFPVRYPHSFDHGYEYALVTEDNRLMLGGWRNHTPGGELGTYDIAPNSLVEDGLKNFAKHHYKIDETLEWEYSWAGIMASSKTGFPFIGPTSSPLIYTVAGFTGHGFSWAHGSAKLLAKIMAGKPIPTVAKHFNPRLI